MSSFATHQHREMRLYEHAKPYVVPYAFKCFLIKTLLQRTDNQYQCFPKLSTLKDIASIPGVPPKPIKIYQQGTHVRSVVRGKSATECSPAAPSKEEQNLRAPAEHILALLPEALRQSTVRANE